MPRHLFLLLALLLTQCSQPVEFKRDSPTDPQSDKYAPSKPRNFVLSFDTNKRNRLAWRVNEFTFDSILIERKTTRENEFIRLATIPKNLASYVDTSGFMTYPMSYRVGSLYRRDGKDFITYSDTLSVDFGTIGKPEVFYHLTNFALTSRVFSTWKANFKTEYWVKSHPDSSFRRISIQNGTTGFYSQSIPFRQGLYGIDVAVVYLMGNDDFRAIIDSTVTPLTIAYPLALGVDPMNEASGQVNWVNPVDSYDDILVRINNDEWVMPPSATSLTLPRYFKSGIPYEITVRYRVGSTLFSGSTIIKEYIIPPPTLSYGLPAESTIRLEANSISDLGEFIVLEESQNMGPFTTVDSVLIESSTHSFDVTDLDTLSTYRFRARTSTSQPSAVIDVSRGVSYALRPWDSGTQSNRLAVFSDIDDRYLGYDASNSMGMYDLATSARLFTIPTIPNTAPSGFSNDGHFIARLSQTSTTATFRRYDAAGTPLGDFTIPGYRYHIGRHEDVIYIDPLKSTIERYHMPTGATTVIMTGIPAGQIGYFGADEAHLVVKIGTRFILFSYSETEGYQLESNRILNELSGIPYSLQLTSSHIIMAIRSQVIHYIDMASGSVQSFDISALPMSLNHISEYEWVFFNGDLTVIKDIRMSTDIRIPFTPTSGVFSAQMSKVRHRNGFVDIFMYRQSNNSSNPNQIIWVRKKEYWVAE